MPDHKNCIKIKYKKDDKVEFHPFGKIEFKMSGKVERVTVKWNFTKLPTIIYTLMCSDGEYWVVNELHIINKR